MSLATLPGKRQIAEFDAFLLFTVERSHPSDKNKNVARVGHPHFTPSGVALKRERGERPESLPRRVVRFERQLESDDALELNDTRRCIAAQERTEDAGRRIRHAGDSSKSGGACVAVGLAEVGVVEDIEQLGADLEVRVFKAQRE